MEIVIAATLLSALLWAAASHQAERLATARSRARQMRHTPASAVRR
jgi:hypothetical protein